MSRHLCGKKQARTGRQKALRVKPGSLGGIQGQLKSSLAAGRGCGALLRGGGSRPDQQCVSKAEVSRGPGEEIPLSQVWPSPTGLRKEAPKTTQGPNLRNGQNNSHFLCQVHLCVRAHTDKSSPSSLPLPLPTQGTSGLFPDLKRPRTCSYAKSSEQRHQV